MKKFALAAAVVVASAPAFAGGVTPAPVQPVTEPVVIVEDTRSSAGGIVVPVLALILLAVALAQD